MSRNSQVSKGTEISIMEDREIYWEVERTIDYAFDHKFFLNMYEYLKLKKTKKVDVREFIESSSCRKRLRTLSMILKSTSKVVVTTITNNSEKGMGIWVNQRQEK